MTLSLELCAYRPGDLAAVRNGAFDPFLLLGADAELCVQGLRSIWCDGVLICCMGYVSSMPGVAGAFALVDRVAAKGCGLELVRTMRAQSEKWIAESGAHRIEASARADDRTACAFLRALGYRFESVIEAGAPDGTDLHQFKIIRRKTA